MFQTCLFFLSSLKLLDGCHGYFQRVQIPLQEMPSASNDLFTWRMPDGSYQFGMQGQDQWRVEKRYPNGAVSVRFAYRTPDGKVHDSSFTRGVPPVAALARGNDDEGAAVDEEKNYEKFDASPTFPDDVKTKPSSKDVLKPQVKLQENITAKGKLPDNSKASQESIPFAQKSQQENFPSIQKSLKKTIPFAQKSIQEGVHDAPKSLKESIPDFQKSIQEGVHDAPKSLQESIGDIKTGVKNKLVKKANWKASPTGRQGLLDSYFQKQKEAIVSPPKPSYGISYNVRKSQRSASVKEVPHAFQTEKTLPKKFLNKEPIKRSARERKNSKFLKYIRRGDEVTKSDFTLF